MSDYIKRSDAIDAIDAICESCEYYKNERIVEKLNIPVITSMLGRDLLSGKDQLNYGYVGAAYGHRYANLLIYKKADLII